MVRYSEWKRLGQVAATLTAPLVKAITRALPPEAKLMHLDFKNDFADGKKIFMEKNTT